MKMKHVRRTVVVLLVMAVLALGSSGAAAQPRAGKGAPQATKTFTLVPSGAGENPESVTFDRRTGAFYVSGLGTGTIYRGTLAGDALTPFLPGGADGRTTALGVKVDRDGLLYVAGGATGAIWVYDTATKQLVAKFQTPGSGGFINDLVVTQKGDVFATDSFRPTLWAISAAQVRAGGGTPTAISVAPEVQYVAGQFNLNGIAATEGGKVLLVVDTVTGQLFRIRLDRRAPGGRVIDEVQVSGGPLPSADGMFLDGGRLLVAQNGLGGPQQIDVLKLEAGGARARVVERITDPTFQTPTGITRAKHLWLVTNSDFATNTPPYTVSALPRGGDGHGDDE